MAVVVKHALVSVTPDNPAYEIKPSNWNDSHVITGLAAVATSGAYSDLSGKPTLGTLAALNAVDLTANVTGILPFANGGSGSNATIGAGQIVYSDGSKYTGDANLTWSATTGLLSLKPISAPGPGSHDETFGATSKIWVGGGQNTAIGYNAHCGINGSADPAQTQNTVIGADSFTGNTSSYNIIVGASSSTSSSFSVLIGPGLTNSALNAIVIGGGSAVSATSIGAIGTGLVQSHVGGLILGANINSVLTYELKYGGPVANAVSPSSFRMVGSTGSFVERDNFRIGNVWIDSTDATRKVRTIFYTNDTAEREFMRADANGGGVDLFLNANTSPLSAAGFSLGTASLPWQQLFVDYTNSATVGSVTINKISGTCNMAALGNTLTVTNGLVTANSRIMATLASDPGAAIAIWCVGAAGSFTVNTRPAVVNQTAIDFVIFP